jgi:hypothetical protein
MAFMRIYVARKARRFPAILDAIEDGRLNLTSIRLLGPYLTEATAADLLAAAAHKTKPELLVLLAARFPRADAPTLITPMGHASSACLPNGVEMGTDFSNCWETSRVPEHVELPLPAVSAPTGPPRARVEPLAPERYALQVTIAGATHDKLQRDAPAAGGCRSIR